ETAAAVGEDIIGAGRKALRRKRHDFRIVRMRVAGHVPEEADIIRLEVAAADVARVRRTVLPAEEARLSGERSRGIGRLHVEVDFVRGVVRRRPFDLEAEVAGQERAAVAAAGVVAATLRAEHLASRTGAERGTGRSAAALELVGVADFPAAR